MTKVAIIRCEKNENKCPLTSCFKTMMETKEGFARYEQRPRQETGSGNIRDTPVYDHTGVQQDLTTIHQLCIHRRAHGRSPGSSGW